MSATVEEFRAEDGGPVRSAGVPNGQTLCAMPRRDWLAWAAGRRRCGRCSFIPSYVLMGSPAYAWPAPLFSAVHCSPAPTGNAPPETCTKPVGAARAALGQRLEQASNALPWPPLLTLRSHRMSRPFDTLTPDLVLDAVESIGFQRRPPGTQQLREPRLSSGHRRRPAADRQVLPPRALER